MALLEKKTMELGDGLFIDVDPKLDTVTFRIGEEKKIIKKVDLWAACFTIADAAVQEALMPIRQTEMVTYTKIHTVKLKKAMPEGGLIQVKCKINVPETVNEGLAGTLREKQKRRTEGGIIIPRG